MDDRNLYAAPASDVAHVGGPVDRTNEFFVVSPRKFCVLFFGTFSLYQFYWFYMHWTRYRRAHAIALAPVIRAVLALFYTHALANRVGESLRASRRPYAWTPAYPATAYVATQIVAVVIDIASQGHVPAPIVNVFDVLVLVPSGLALLQIQRAANAACADPRGDSNGELTPANYLWLVLGAVLWLVIVVGVVASFLAEYVGELRP